MTTTVTTEYGPCHECSDPNVTVTIFDEARGEAGPIELLCSNGHEFYLPAEATSRTRITALRTIVRECQAARIDGYVVDMTTASLLVQVYDALSPANREKFGKIPLMKLVNLAWSVTK